MSGKHTRIGATAAWSRPGEVSARCWTVGEAVVWLHRHCGVDMRRAAAGPLATGNDVLAVSTYLRGSSQGLYDERPFEQRSGAVRMTDLQRPVTARSTGPVEMFLVELPFASVGYRPDRRRPGHRELRGVEKRLVATNLDLLRRELPRASDGEAKTLIAAFAGLVRGLVADPDRPDLRRPDFVAGRAAAMRAYVDANLQRVDLKAAQVGAAVGASRATVYREFAPEGGFDRHVTRRRLAMAMADLRGSPPRRGLVAEVAYRWGFADPARFARASRRELGLGPSEVIGLDLEADPGWSD